MRRPLEIFTAIVSLAAAAPVMIVAGAAILATSGRPLFFVQSRSGVGGVPFRMFKLRTMNDPRDPHGRLLPDAARVTRVGRFLRRTRIDELPGLWHLLSGDMTLVGPRPLLPATILAMGEAGIRRGAVRPGLTGWAQVNGNALLGDEQKLALDLWYIDHRSFGLDLIIIWRTLSVIVFGERIDHVRLEEAHASRTRRRG